jgi:hypothetical protein
VTDELHKSAQPPPLCLVGSRNLSDFVYALLQCDGQKPICSPCTRRVTACVYSPRTDMNIEERAELQQLRQQHDATPQKVSDGGGGEEDLLNRLKTLSEHEAVALLLQVRSGTQTNQVSSGPQPGPVAPGDWVWSLTPASGLTFVTMLVESCHGATHSPTLAGQC